MMLNHDQLLSAVRMLHPFHPVLPLMPLLLVLKREEKTNFN
jgi:hypothetical protein